MFLLVLILLLFEVIRFADSTNAEFINSFEILIGIQVGKSEFSLSIGFALTVCVLGGGSEFKSTVISTVL